MDDFDKKELMIENFALQYHKYKNIIRYVTYF